MKWALLAPAGLSIAIAIAMAGCRAGGDDDATAAVQPATSSPAPEASPTPAPEASPTPAEPTPILAGAVCKPARVTLSAGIWMALAFNPIFCVVWRDSHGTETGFRIELHYISQTEPSLRQLFTYLVPPNTIEFVFPAADGPRVDDPEVCRLRDSYRVEVWALLPSGDEPVGGTAGFLHCAGFR